MGFLKKFFRGSLPEGGQAAPTQSSFEHLSEEDLEAHLSVQRYGRFTLTDAIRHSYDLKVTPRYVDSSFPTLVEDLLQDRCDVAMFAVGMTSQRARQLRFSRTYLESDIYAVTTHSSRVVERWEDLDKPGVRIAVQAGTFMEPVMAGALKRATLVVVRPPDTRERELEAGRIDAFMTDYPYSRRLLDNADWARLVAPPAPFYVMPYAYAVKPGDAAWLTQVDDFVARVQRDGRLRAAAERHGLGAIVRNR